MDQDKLLDELRAQRALLQKHLEWLDGKITALDEDKKEPSPVDNEETKEIPLAPKEEQHSPEVTDKTEAEEPSEEEIHSELKRYNSSSSDVVLQAKVGCLVLFVLGILLFLFLLFGLPYFLD